ncbi:hypothetical protein HanRHA438_Chr02g0050921 [Helianthus annuus]|nr:hypothetical protein HanRHA438_Chr02g0050921 [Helianthus annuus]
MTRWKLLQTHFQPLNKRKRSENLHGVRGVTFRNPVTNTIQSQVNFAAEVSVISTGSSSITRDGRYLQSMEDFWRCNLAKEVKKRKEIHAKLKDQEEQTNRFRQMQHFFYDKRMFHLEQMVEQHSDITKSLRLRRMKKFRCVWLKSRSDKNIPIPS